MSIGDSADVEALRRRVQELERRNAELEGRAEKSGHGARRAGALVLVIVAGILAPISTLGLWLRNTVTDTGQYVETVEPLVSDPAIQSFVADRVTDELFARVDVEAAISDALPDDATFLSSALASGVRTVVHEAALRVLESDQFRELWVGANRLAQQQLVAVLTGDSSGLVATGDDGSVSLDLSNVANAVVQRLQERGIDLFDSVQLEPGRFTVEIFQSDTITRAQVAFDAFDTVATVLPWLTVVLFAVAVLVHDDRRRGALWSAVALSLGMGALLLGVAIGRSVYLGAIPSSEIPGDAAAAFFDTLVRFLRQSARALLAVGVVCTLVVAIAGPSPAARRFRAWSARLLGRVGDEAAERGVRFGPAGRWVGRNLTALRVVVVVVAAVVLVAWDRPTAAVVLVVALVAVVTLALIEVMGRGAHEADAAVSSVPPGPAGT